MAVTATLSAILKNKVDHVGIAVPEMLCAKNQIKILAVFRRTPDTPAYTHTNDFLETKDFIFYFIFFIFYDDDDDDDNDRVL